MNRHRQLTAYNCAAMLQHGLVLLMLGPLVPEMISEFGIDDSTTGMLLGVGSLGFMAGPLIAGWLIDRFGFRVVFAAGTAIEIAFFALFGFSPVFFVAVIANFFVHFGSAFVETGANVLPTRIASRRTPHAMMNFVHFFFSIGAFVGPLLIGLYLDLSGEWRPALFYLTIPAGGLLLWTATMRGEDGARGGFAREVTRLKAADAGANDPQERVLQRATVFGAVALLCYVGAEIGISNWLVLYLQRRLAFSTVASSAGLSVLWLFMTLGRYANSLLGERYSSRALVAASSVGGAIAGGLLLFASSPFLVYPLLGALGLCLSGVFPNIMGELNRRVPSRAGTVTAIMATGASGGAALFQWLMGVVAESVSLTVALSIPAFLQLVCLGAFLLALIRPRSTVPDR